MERTTTQYKKITIPYVGSISCKGGALGPVTNPYMETLAEIGTLLKFNYPVLEHLSNGNTVRLSLDNYKDNFEMFQNQQSIAQETEAIVTKMANDIEVSNDRNKAPGAYETVQSAVKNNKSRKSNYDKKVDVLTEN